MLELLAGSPEAAASDAAAINIVLRAGAVLAFVGAVALAALRPPLAPQRRRSRLDCLLAPLNGDDLLPLLAQALDAERHDVAGLAGTAAASCRGRRPAACRS